MGRYAGITGDWSTRRFVVETGDGEVQGADFAASTRQ
jgi:hypothetical protein